MGVKFGDIEASQIIDNEYRIKLISRLLDWILGHNPNLNKPTQEQFEQLKDETVKELQEKYPQSGIKLTK